MTAVDPGASRVTLADGRELGYDRLLLATGAEPRRLTIRGADLDGVHALRTLADCDALRERLVPGARAVVVGAGWIGSEVAASARQLGLDVTVIDPAALPNERIFGAEVGAFYRDVHAAHGIDLALGEGVESFEGDGAVTGVRTTAGRLIACDLVVVGIGVTPRVELARRGRTRRRRRHPRRRGPADLRSGRVRVRRRRPRLAPLLPRAPPRRALGQRAHPGPGRRSRDAGEPTSYDHLPYFFSDQYDVGMEYAGHAPRWDEVVLRGDPASGEFLAFWLRDGRVAAGMNVNVWDVNEQIQALIRSRRADRRRAPGRSRHAARLARRRSGPAKLSERRT